MPSDAVIESKNLSLKVTFPKVTRQHAGIYNLNIGNEKWDVYITVLIFMTLSVGWGAY
jgi:hypothetical protein